MIFNSYIKFSLIVFLAVLFSACEKKGTGSKEGEEGRPEHSKDSSPKPKEEEGPGVEEPPKGPPSLPEDKKEGDPSKGAPPPDRPKKDEAEVSPPQGPSKAEVEPDNEQAAALAEIRQTVEKIPDPEKHFTSDQLKATGLLGEEKDASLFAVYVYPFLIDMDNRLRNGQIPQGNLEYLKPLCADENDCSKGINLNKLTRAHMAYFVRLIGSHMTSVFAYMTIKDEPDVEPMPIYILHDFMEYIENGQRKSVNIEEHIETMRKQKVKKIVVNLSRNANHTQIKMEDYFLLGKYIKEQEVDLYVEGKCSVLCFNYLLPAAKRIYVGPYGHISARSFARGLKKGTEKIFSLQLEETGQEIAAPYFAEDNTEALVQSFQTSFQTQGQANIQEIETKKRKLNYFLTTLDTWEEGLGKGIKEKLDEFLYGKGYEVAEESFPNLNDPHLGEFVESLSLEERASLKRMFFNFSEHSKPLRDFVNRLQQRINTDFQYYDEIGVKENLISQSGYSFFDFLDLSTFLVRMEIYLKVFSVPRAYYNIPEEEKTYREVAPSVGLLRTLGFDIQGENHIEMFRMYYGEGERGAFIEQLEYDDLIKDQVLYLDKKRIENCGFFAPDATYTEGTLKDCLAQE